MQFLMLQPCRLAAVNGHHDLGRGELPAEGRNHLEPVLAPLVHGYKVVAVVGRAVRLVLEGTLLGEQADVDAGEVDGSGGLDEAAAAEDALQSFLSTAFIGGRQERQNQEQ